MNRRGDAGSVAIELALLAPLLIVLVLLVVFAGRVAQVDAAVTRAASEAARAASLRQHPGDASADAQTSASRDLVAQGVTCRELDADIDTERFEAGGAVTVNLNCTMSMADLALLGVPGSRVFEGRASEAVDYHRSQG